MQIPADAATKSPFLSISTDASAKKTTQNNVLPQLRPAGGGEYPYFVPRQHSC
jgi:hypothetical protein